MSNGLLSQDELDALMNPKPLQKELFSAQELDALAEISNIAMGSAATAFSTLIDKQVKITAPKAELAELKELSQGIEQSFIIVVDYTSGFDGSSVMVLSRHEGGIIIDLLMGGDGHNPPNDFTEIHLSAVAEGMNQMMGSAATSLSTMLSNEIRVSPPKVSLEQSDGLNSVFPGETGKIVKISFDMHVQDLAVCSMVQLFTVKVAKEMVNSKLSQVKESLGGIVKPEVKALPKDDASFIDSLFSQMPKKESPAQPIPSIAVQAPFNPSSQPGSVQVSPVQFAPLKQVAGRSDSANLGLILDVPIEVSVNLGKAHKTIKEILEFSPGSIVELDKLAGESVDLIANGKLLAKGEVVVINENFGIRITEIERSIGKLSN